MERAVEAEEVPADDFEPEPEPDYDEPEPEPEPEPVTKAPEPERQPEQQSSAKAEDDEEGGWDLVDAAEAPADAVAGAVSYPMLEPVPASGFWDCAAMLST